MIVCWILFCRGDFHPCPFVSAVVTPAIREIELINANVTSQSPAATAASLRDDVPIAVDEKIRKMDSTERETRLVLNNELPDVSAAQHPAGAPLPTVSMLPVANATAVALVNGTAVAVVRQIPPVLQSPQSEMPSMFGALNGGAHVPAASPNVVMLSAPSSSGVVAASSASVRQREDVVEKSPASNYVKVRGHFCLVTNMCDSRRPNSLSEHHAAIAPMYSHVMAAIRSSTRVTNFSVCFRVSSCLQYSEVVGRGSFKTVYKGQDLEHGNLVAWNEISIKNLQARDKKRILNEMKLLKTMQHPCLITFYGAWVNKETEKVVFITELMSSGTLRG